MEIQTTTRIIIRQATAEDIPALAEMAAQAFWETFTGMMPEIDLQTYLAEAFTPEQIRLEWEDTDSLFLIATFKDQWAGYAKLSTKPRAERQAVKNYLELDRLYLLKSFHGQKIGASLMEYSLQYARDWGFQELWLNVWERNIQAIDFYLRWGFEHIDHTIRMRGNDAQKALWMRKVATAF